MTSPASNIEERRALLSESKRDLLEKRLRGLAKPAAAPAGFPLRKSGDRAPLSSAQERMWFFSELQPASAVYNMPYGFRLRGEPNSGALRAALDQLVARHEILRTRFVSEDGAPVQLIAPPTPVGWVQIDLSAEPAALAGRLAAEYSRPFDLTADLMVRAALFQLGPSDHFLALTFHHISSDLLSADILFRELSELYAGEVRGAPAQLPPPAIQYGDFAAWEREWLAGPEPEAHLAYWKAQLAGAPALLELPTDRPRPAALSFRGARAMRAIAPAVIEALQLLGRAEGATLFVTLLTAFQVLLSRLSQQSDIVVGIPTAGRTREPVAASPGLFVNTLAVRTDLADAPGFRDLLRRVRATTLDALFHQDLPFNKLVETLQPVRDGGYSPVVQAMFTLQPSAELALQLAGLQVAPVAADLPTARFDLTLFAEETAQNLELTLEYSTDLFDAATADRMLGQFATLLEAAAADPERSVAELPLLTAAERRQLLADWNDTALEIPGPAQLQQLFETQAQATPDAVALVVGRQRLTYQALDRRAEELAERLRALGVGPETRVALFLERSAHLIVALLGVLKAGGAYVAMDPAYPAERLAFIVYDSQASVILTQSSLRGAVPPSAAQLVCVDETTPLPARERRAGPAGDPSHLAYVIYTSGSTGKPKGVAIEHRNAVTFVRWAQTVFSPRDLDGVLAGTSICFDLSIFEIFVPLSRGGKIILADHGLAIRHLPAMDEVRLINTVPSVMSELLRLGQVPRSVETVNLAGEAVPQELVRQLYALPQIRRVHDLYGPTETTTYSTFALRTAAGRATIGRPIANTAIYLLDRHRQPVPIGVAGEIFIGGAGVARGYLGRPELTAERFVRDPFSADSGARLYRTGDHARYRADGNLEYLGRADQQVKLRGFRIELGEIESALRIHPEIAEAAVVVRENGGGDRRLVGYVATKLGGALPAGWREFLQQKLPEAMIPAVLVVLPALPKTANGKVDRRALPEPDPAAPAGSRQTILPRNELETKVARIWEAVLGVAGIGVTDRFFDLGGHSLLAVRLAVQIEKTLEVKLPVAAIFRAPTVEQLARLIEDSRSPAADSALLPIQPHGSRPPLFLVHGMGGGLMWGFANLARYFGEDQPVYAFKASEPEHLAEFDTIEKMAAHYLAAMRRFQPQGPYRIGGYCFGGNVAYEMARMLEAQGQPASLLILMNSWPANSGADRLPLTPAGLGKFLLNLCHWTSRLWSWQSGARGKFLHWKAQAIKKRISRWCGFQAPAAETDVELIVDLSGVPWSERKLWQAHLRALKRYYPQPYNGKVTLLRTRGYPLFCSFDFAHGWTRYARGGVAVHLVPGTHETLMVEPHVAPLAREFKRHLDAEGEARPPGALAVLAGLPARP